MRASEFITETSEIKNLEKSHIGAIKNMNSFPAQNQNSGSLYLNWRMGVALAGAPHYPMPMTNQIAGNPIFHGYTEIEQEMIEYAAKQVGDNSRVRLTDNDSNEAEGTNTDSPIAKRKLKNYRTGK
jgi:hypothetical protein